MFSFGINSIAPNLLREKKNIIEEDCKGKNEYNFGHTKGNQKEFSQSIGNYIFYESESFFLSKEVFFPSLLTEVMPTIDSAILVQKVVSYKNDD